MKLSGLVHLSPKSFPPKLSSPLFFSLADNNLNFSFHLVLMTSQGPPQWSHPRCPYTRILRFYLPHLQQGCASQIFPSSVLSRPSTRSETVLPPQQKAAQSPSRCSIPPPFCGTGPWESLGNPITWRPPNRLTHKHMLHCLSSCTWMPQQSCAATHHPRVGPEAG